MALRRIRNFSRRVGVIYIKWSAEPPPIPSFPRSHPKLATHKKTGILRCPPCLSVIGQLNVSGSLNVSGQLNVIGPLNVSDPLKPADPVQFTIGST